MHSRDQMVLTFNNPISLRAEWLSLMANYLHGGISLFMSGTIFNSSLRLMRDFLKRENILHDSIYLLE